MRSTAATEAGAVDKPAKTRTPARRAAAKPAAAKAAAPRTRATPARRTAPVRQRRPVLGVVKSGLIVLVAIAAAAALVLAGRWDWSSDTPTGDARAVSSEELASFASTQATPLHWAGDIPGRTLELTSTTTGTFVRYLPANIEVGGPERALTVATYPLPDAYQTAVSRATQPGMTSRRTENGGLAVWSNAQPTNVYVAFRGVPSLIEVYAPAASDARSLALSGRIQLVRP